MEVDKKRYNVFTDAIHGLFTGYGISCTIYGTMGSNEKKSYNLFSDKTNIVFYKAFSHQVNPKLICDLRTKSRLFDTRTVHHN
jgi:hypothetical protein